MTAIVRFIAALLVLALVQTPAHAFEQGSLLVWVDPGHDIRALTRLAEAYGERNDIEITVAAPAQGRRAFQQREVDNDGPDIYIGHHDNLTDWALAGILTPIQPPSAARNALNEPYWSVLTYQETVYGYPLAVEGVVQACNADLVNEPFDSWQSVWQAEGEMRRRNARPLLFDPTNLYLNYGLMTAQGGYVFGRTETGEIDTNNVGWTHPAAVAALSFMQSMIEGGLLPDRINGEETDRAFTSERAACVLAAASDLPVYQDAGIDLVVGPYPGLNGEVGRGFAEVTAAFINGATPNRTLARRFIENALLNDAGFEALTSAVAPAAPLRPAALEDWLSDEDWHAQAWPVWQAAEPLPSVPAMGLYWMLGNDALQAILYRNEPIQATLVNAAAQLSQLAVIPELPEEETEDN
ncbi:sugar ABC transporter substrate-binding protein [Saccharospirillum mangrovi]|uniref:sugar ABC transporter substrate-binding protein n=1 Tax=Saccharospirillum mangrovi TaxID=2161747 RepID=UPI0013007607|nr:extracellular solute-binding protein [Saccharospirillum mangrovi]